MLLLLNEYFEKMAADNENNPLWWQRDARPKPKPLRENQDNTSMSVNVSV